VRRLTGVLHTGGNWSQCLHYDSPRQAPLMPPAVCFYFQVHQPRRLRPYSVFETDPNYFDDAINQQILKRVATRCYLPVTKLLLDQVERHRGRFRIAFSLSGQVIEQLQRWSPEVIEAFYKLSQTGCVEFLSETYDHSLASEFSTGDFEDSIDRHDALIEDVFGQHPTVFRNTELIFSDALASFVSGLGRFQAVLGEGVDRLLDGRSANHVYQSAPPSSMPLLLRNYTLSDNLAFRYGDPQWAGHPLSAASFADSITASGGDVCNLFMDFETFGEHKLADSGIFDLLRALPSQVLSQGGSFVTPSEAAEQIASVGVYEAAETTSWADTERDLSAWTGNTMQQSAINALYELEESVHAARDAKLLSDWHALSASDHFYYMATKQYSDGEVHAQFSPYQSPYDAYINYMNVLEHLGERVDVAPVDSD